MEHDEDDLILSADDGGEAVPLPEWREGDPRPLERYRRLYVPDRDGRFLQRNARIALANLSERVPAR